MQDETHNQILEIKRTRKQAPKINQLPKDCGFDGEPEHEDEYEDDESLN